MIPAARPLIDQEEREAVDRVLKSGVLAQGPEVSSFEEEFSEYVDHYKCVAVNSGTSALHLALLAGGIGPGDEVIVPSFSYAATANSVALTGAKPVFVDINLETFNISPEAIKAAITSKTKAIQPVHLYGQPAQMDEIQKIAEENDLLIFEDAAQAHMAKFKGKYVGSFGTSGSFSFYPTKNMTSGEGGMISCSTESFARNCKLLRNQGMEKKYENEVVGFNTRMTEIHAAIGRVQLKKLPEWTRTRQANAKFLDENLKGVITPFVLSDAEHVYHQYTIRVIDHDRDVFAKELEKLGVGSGVYYPTPIHKLPSFRQTEDLPNTDVACKQVLSIPVHPSLTKNELEQIVNAVNSISKAGS